MTDFSSLPFEKKLNSKNIFARIEKLERKKNQVLSFRAESAQDVTHDLGLFRKGGLTAGDARPVPLQDGTYGTQTGVGIVSPGIETTDGDIAAIYGMKDGEFTFYLSQETGKVYALLGNIAGWEIIANAIRKLTGGVGIVLDSATPKIQVGDTAGTHIIIDGANQRIRSSNYVAGASGSNWDTATGDLEVNNLTARGMIKTAVFQKGTASSVGGQLLVLDSDSLAVDMTAADNSTVTILGNTTFAAGDMLRMKSAGNDEWLEVTSAASAPTYTVTRDKAAAYAANANPAWTKGQAVVNYGASGAGGGELAAGAAPFIRVFNHAGAPWTTISEVVKMDEEGIHLANTAGVIRFRNAAGSSSPIRIFGNTNDDFLVQHDTAGKGMKFVVQTTSAETPYLRWGESSDTADSTLFQILPASAGGRTQFGYDHYLDTLSSTATSSDTATVYLNERGKDIDVLIKDAANTALLQTDAGAAQVKYKGVAIREVLGAARTYYVRTDGSDSNNGLANTAGGAFLTIQKAVDVAAALDLSIYNVTIQIADGTYSPTTNLLKPLVGSGSVTIQGNSTTPANVHVSTSTFAFQALQAPCYYIIKDMKITPGGNTYSIYTASGGVIVEYSNINFATAGASGYHIAATNGSSVRGTGNYTISGAAAAHAYVAGSAIFRIDSITVTLSGTPAFGQFVLVQDLGYILSFSVTFSGAATGLRYNLTTNSVVQTFGAGANYFPGNAAGTTATGGQYA